MNILNFFDYYFYPYFMKPIFLLSSLLFFCFIARSQPDISTISWVGQNNEYLKISKTNVSLYRENTHQEFEIDQYEKNAKDVPMFHLIILNYQIFFGIILL